ncbi:MAG: co-chaperone GroES [Spirochaetia bacterium]|jgi:chaperonin GroES|nr:co-chaperone GroES [Spirochaetia bacterium]
MKITPLGDRVLVKITESEAKTKGGLFIPQTAQEKTQTGIVSAIGDDKDAIKVKVGQNIMYDKYAGTSIKIENVDYLIVKAADIIAVVE